MPLIRRYRLSDTPSLLALFHDTVHAVNSRDYSPAQVDAWAPPVPDETAWAARLGARDTLVAEDGGLLIGFCDLEADGHLDHLYCHKDWQRRGVGTRLLAETERIAREKGITRLATEASITARPFFVACGFRTHREQTVSVRGVAFVNYRMEKDLPSPLRWGPPSREDQEQWADTRFVRPYPPLREDPAKQGGRSIPERDQRMVDIARRFETNPILRPSDVKPSRAGLEVECLLNPGSFRWRGKTWLLLRVAERPRQTEGTISTPVLDPNAPGGINIVSYRLDDPLVSYTDPRSFQYRGESYLTTLSHLRLASSDDGVHFTVAEKPTLVGRGELESFGIEDCRVSQIEGRFYLTYTAVSPHGIGVGLSSTDDWENFTQHGMIISPSNKDCALFPQKVGGDYLALHRPSNLYIGGPFIWLARSPDLIHWGRHQCLAHTRPNLWDSARVGAGAEPILTDRGWLEIYHGADSQPRYCLGALLLDRDDPGKVLARSQEPIMEPLAPYELTGFFGNVVFTNGHVVEGDTVMVYYGASDEVICGATFSIREILASLEPTRFT